MYGKTTRAIWLGISMTVHTFIGAAAYAQDGQSADLMFVFDASGSMWGQVDGVAKIDIARDVFSDISEGWVDSQQAVGLIAYGHRRKGDCSDIELLQPPLASGVQSLATQVQRLVPRGKTPLSEAVRMAAQTLKYTENAATVVLLTDGIETCDLDPCAVGAELERLGVDFTAHVIGFDIQSAADRAQLQCLATNTGGQYLDANSADALSIALTRVSEAPPAEPAGTVTAQIVLAEAEGTARPAQVALAARDPKSGETRGLGVLQGTEQVITGLSIDLPVGLWTFTATGDGGEGEVTVALDAQTGRITIPFSANAAVFEYLGPQSFTQGADITFQLRSRKPLQENATFYAALVPAGASSFNDNISFVYRFGTDAETTEHAFYAWEYPLEPGQYEIVLQSDGVYDLEPNLGRFAFEVTQEDAVPSFSLSQLVEPLSPGTGGGLRVDGPVAANDQVMFIGLDGQDSQLAEVSAGGLVLVPTQLQPGTYRLQLLREDGTDYHLDVIDILPASAQDMGDHSDTGETAETMLSDEELAAENGAQTLPFTVWASCDDPAPCRVQDGRVSLEWAMPAGWASEEPFYYTTAGGAQAEHPTVHMGRMHDGAFNVALNPRQWDAQLGPCVEVPQGMLCHEATDVLRDQTDFELIYFSFHGDMPKPDGWLPLDRSWTIDDKIMGGTIGLMKMVEPDERAETIKVQLMLSNPNQFGLQDEAVATAELRLGWDNRPVVTSMNGTVAFAGGSLELLLSRPGDWDGTSNQWSGQITNTATNQTAFVKLY